MDTIVIVPTAVLKENNMGALKDYQYYLNESLNHNEDCQHYNSDRYPDVSPRIMECVCDLMENIRKNEDHGEMQFEVERGN